MEVLQDEVALLSNYEVYDLLTHNKQTGKSKKSSGTSENLATVTYETTGYLSKTPCAYQNSSIVADFLKALQPYKLTKAEKLQLLNLRPSSPVELQPVIEEIEERFTEAEIEELVSIVTSVLPDWKLQASAGAEGGDQQGNRTATLPLADKVQMYMYNHREVGVASMLSSVRKNYEYKSSINSMLGPYYTDIPSILNVQCT